MPGSSFSRFDWCLIGITTVVTLCVVPWLLRFERTHSDWSPEAAEALAAMSEDERSDVAANYERLHNQLSNEKRERVEAIHASIGQDPQLASVMERFHDWLQELDITERDSIRSADTIEAKVAEVQSLLAEELVDEESFEVNFDPDDSRMRMFHSEEFIDKLRQALRENSISRLRISNREFDGIVDVLVATFPVEMRARFGELTSDMRPGIDDSERYRLRARGLMSTLRDQRRSREWMTPEIAGRIFDRLDDSEFRQRVKALDPDQQRVLAMLIVLRGGDQFRNLGRYFPSESQAAEIFTQLDRKKQIELMGLSPTWSRMRLNLMFVAQSSDVPEDIAAFARSVLSGMERWRSHRGRSGRRGGSGRGSSNGRNRSGRGEDRGGRPGGRGPGGPRPPLP